MKKKPDFRVLGAQLSFSLFNFVLKGTYFQVSKYSFRCGLRSLMFGRISSFEKDTFIWKSNVLVTPRIRYSSGNVELCLFGMGLYVSGNLQAAKKELTA